MADRAAGRPTDTLQPFTASSGADTKAPPGIGDCVTVRRQTPGPVGNVRDHVAPAIRRQRISVQEHDRYITVSRVAIAHERIECSYGGHTPAFLVVLGVTSFDTTTLRL